MSVRDQVEEALAKNLWSQAYADFADETDDNNDRVNRQFMDDNNLPWAGPGEDWYDVVPRTPGAFFVLAADVVADLERRTGRGIDALVGSDDPDDYATDLGFSATGSGGSSGQTGVDNLAQSMIPTCGDVSLYIGNAGNVYAHVGGFGDDALIFDFSGRGTRGVTPSGVPGLRRWVWRKNPHGRAQAMNYMNVGARIGSQYGSPREIYYSQTRNGRQKRVRRYEHGRRTWPRENPADDAVDVVAELDRIARSVGDSNLIGSLVRVPGSAYYRPPPRGMLADVPDETTLRSWLMQARHVARVLRSRSNPRITGTPDWELPGLVEQQERFAGAAQCDRCHRWVEVHAPVKYHPFSCCLSCMEGRGHDGTCTAREPRERLRNPPRRGYPKGKTRRVAVRGKTSEGLDIIAPIIIPTDVPPPDRAEYLHELYKKWVTHPDGHWKGPAIATVPAHLANDVAEAMDFMGSVVDRRTPMDGGRYELYSDGYWAHGF